jgi:hypothetical protein
MSWWTVRLRVRARSAFQAACPGSYQSVSMESSGLLSTSMLCNRGAASTSTAIRVGSWPHSSAIACRNLILRAVVPSTGRMAQCFVLQMFRDVIEILHCIGQTQSLISGPHPGKITSHILLGRLDLILVSCAELANSLG